MTQYTLTRNDSKVIHLTYLRDLETLTYKILPDIISLLLFLLKLESVEFYLFFMIEKSDPLSLARRIFCSVVESYYLKIKIFQTDS